jgi:hypothetical protein
LFAVNNLWVGGGAIPARPGQSTLRNNFAVGHDELFAPSTAAEYRLKPSSAAWGRALLPDSTRDQDLSVTREFRAPRGSVPIQLPVRQPGALQS